MDGLEILLLKGELQKVQDPLEQTKWWLKYHKYFLFFEPVVQTAFPKHTGGKTSEFYFNRFCWNKQSAWNLIESKAVCYGYPVTQGWML